MRYIMQISKYNDGVYSTAQAACDISAKADTAMVSGMLMQALYATVDEVNEQYELDKKKKDEADAIKAAEKIAKAASDNAPRPNIVDLMKEEI